MAFHFLTPGVFDSTLVINPRGLLPSSVLLPTCHIDTSHPKKGRWLLGNLLSYFLNDELPSKPSHHFFSFPLSLSLTRTDILPHPQLTRFVFTFEMFFYFIPHAPFFHSLTSFSLFLFSCLSLFSLTLCALHWKISEQESVWRKIFFIDNDDRKIQDCLLVSSTWIMMSRGYNKNVLCSPFSPRMNLIFVIEFIF